MSDHQDDQETGDFNYLQPQLGDFNDINASGLLMTEDDLSFRQSTVMNETLLRKSKILSSNRSIGQ